jgi:hypothetical protein
MKHTMNSKIYELRGEPSVRVKADIGIEIEMELDHQLPLKVVGWTGHRDDSLRGNSIELVSPPMRWEDSLVKLTNLQQQIRDMQITIKDSIRAGVHIHVNMLDKTLLQLAKFVQIYAIIESTLINYCGEDRVGNLFCLRFRDAEFAVDRFTEALKRNDIFVMDTDDLRYCALNLRSLLVHGTVEFRTLKTPTSLVEIQKWIDAIKQLQDYADQIDSMESVIEVFSMLGPRAFVEEVFGPMWKDFNKFYDERGTIIGMRYAQQMAQHKYW